MSNDIKIEIDISDIQEQLKKVSAIPKGTTTAFKRALNKTVVGMKTDASKEMIENYTVKKKDLSKTLKTHKANNSNLSALLLSQGRPIRLIKFKHRKNRKPGKAGKTSAFTQVKKLSSGGFIKKGTSKAFIATVSYGKDNESTTTGIFVRTGVKQKRKKGRYKDKITENIDQLYGPGDVQMLSEKSVKATIEKKAIERFNENLEHEINYLLEEADKK